MLYSSQEMEAAAVSADDRLMDTEDMVHTYSGILPSHKKCPVTPLAETWIDAEV